MRNLERKKLRSKEWKKLNRKKLNEYERRWRESHKESVRAIQERYRLKHAERLKQSKNAYYLRNKEKCNERMSKYQKNNRPKVNARLRVWRKANWPKHISTLAKREAIKRNAYPQWANSFFIEEIYDLAKLRSQHLGVKHHVDHIVPLQSNIVCGLHCEQNLRVIPGSINSSKGNRHWPDMP